MGAWFIFIAYQGGSDAGGGGGGGGTTGTFVNIFTMVE